jgi:hypothetical protein
VKLSVLSVAYPLAPVGPDAAGGSEQILSLLDRELVRRGHESVVVACEGSESAGRLLTIPRSCSELDERVRERAQQDHRRAIQRALSLWDFDIIHMHSLDFHAYAPGRPARTRDPAPAPRLVPGARLPHRTASHLARLRFRLPGTRLPALPHPAAARR